MPKVRADFSARGRGTHRTVYPTHFEVAPGTLAVFLVHIRDIAHRLPLVIGAHDPGLFLLRNVGVDLVDFVEFAEGPNNRRVII